MPRPPVRIDLLGTFRVAVAGETVPEAAWRGRRARQPVQMLALSAGRRLTRDEVIDALWPDLDFDAAGANLRKVAHYVRRATGRSDAIVLQGGIVALFPESRVEMDLDELETAAQSVEGDEAAQLADRYRGGSSPTRGTTTGHRCPAGAPTSWSSVCGAGVGDGTGWSRWSRPMRPRTPS